MNRRSFPFLLPATAAMLAMVLAGPAVAVTDAATGFGIAPPAPFTAERSAANAEDVAFSIRSPDGQPPAAGTGALCRAGFKAAATSSGADQPTLNAKLDRPPVLDEMRKPLKPRYVIEREDLFQLGEARGIAYTAIPRAGPNADTVRVVLSFVETPKGRVSLVCATPAPHLEAARPVFEAIRATLILPK
ncbi:MAG TPA: hypothetical protein PLQ11_02600 [Beijerinckiaceae bacterium]|nr:hypothetical protein [Beijerinckiaceae bacterium]